MPQEKGHYANDCTDERVERPPRNDGAARSADGTPPTQPAVSDVQLLMDAIVEEDGKESAFNVASQKKVPRSIIRDFNF